MIAGMYSKSQNLLKSVYDDFKEFLSPSLCLGCGNEISLENPFFCHNCFVSLKRNNPGAGPVCPYCGRPGEVASVCSFCADIESSRLYFWGAYDGLLKESITMFKFGGMVELGRVLADLAADSLASRLADSSFDMIVPVPLYKARRRKREFNQSEIIAEILAKRFGIELKTDHLVRIRHTAQQAKLEESQRWKNVEGTFALRENAGIAGKQVLLVDDIVTTGATVFEAGRPLREAGASGVTVFSLAYAV